MRQLQRREDGVGALSGLRGEPGDRVHQRRPGAVAARRGGDGQVEALAEPIAPGGPLRRVLPAGLGDHLDRADLEPFEGPHGMVGAEQHGQGVLAHQLAEEGQPVHPGHVHVEHDGRRHGPLHDLDGLVRVRRQQGDEALLGLDDRLERLPGDGAVVDDQDGQGGAARHGAATLRKIEAASFRKQTGPLGEDLAIADDEPAPRLEAPGEAIEQDEAFLLAEVDRHVAAEDRLEVLRQRPGGLAEVQVLERHEPADLRRDPERALPRPPTAQEEPAEPLGSDVGQVARLVDGAGGGTDDAQRDVRRPDLDRRRRDARQRLGQHHRQAVGLLPGRAARRPDADRPGGRGAGPDQPGQVVGEGLQLDRLAEERRVVDGGQVDQQLHPRRRRPWRAGDGRGTR